VGRILADRSASVRLVLFLRIQVGRSLNINGSSIRLTFWVHDRTSRDQHGNNGVARCYLTVLRGEPKADYSHGLHEVGRVTAFSRGYLGETPRGPAGRRRYFPSNARAATVGSFGCSTWNKLFPHPHKTCSHVPRGTLLWKERNWAVVIACRSTNFEDSVAALKSVIAMHCDSHYSAPISRFSEN
jgi:hypothetical protein